jgi:hypothetical protein
VDDEVVVLGQLRGQIGMARSLVRLPEPPVHLAEHAGEARRVRVLLEREEAFEALGQAPLRPTQVAAVQLHERDLQRRHVVVQLEAELRGEREAPPELLPRSVQVTQSSFGLGDGDE